LTGEGSRKCDPFRFQARRIQQDFPLVLPEAKSWSRHQSGWTVYHPLKQFADGSNDCDDYKLTSGNFSECSG
jgi:hypothetical protein